MHLINRFRRTHTVVSRAIRPLAGLSALAACLLAATPASADVAGVCAKSEDPGTRVSLTQDHGRGTVTIASTPSRKNQVVRVEYDDETYATRFDANGQASLNFALVGVENKVIVRGGEFGAIRCQVSFPEIATVYRAILRWHDPVRLDLHVIEPGRRVGGYGDVHPDARNTALDRGIGQMDVVTDPEGAGATGEQSYVVDETARPKEGGLFTFRFDYVSRGARPVAPFCGTGPQANISLTLLILDHGQLLPARNYDTGSIPCGQSIPDELRLQRLR